MTEAVRESARMFLLRNVLAKGALNAPDRSRTYHWSARVKDYARKSVLIAF